MIFSLRGDDYRNFFNHFSPFPLNTESEHVLPNDFKVDIHEIKGLRNYGIMSPAPWSGAYQSFLNSLPSNPPNNTLTSLLVDEQTQLALVPARTSTMESFSTSLSLLTVAIVSSNVPYVDDFSTNRVTTCTNSLYSFGFQTLMDPLSNYLFFLYVAFASTFVCCCYFALSLVIFVSLTTCNLVFIGWMKTSRLTKKKSTSISCCS